MTIVLLLLVAQLGHIDSIYLGGFDSENDCKAALLSKLPQVQAMPTVKTAPGAVLLCGPLREV